MREIKSINSREEAESLIGARVESWTGGFRDAADYANGVITDVHSIDLGQRSAKFDLAGKRSVAQVSPQHEWTLRVVQEPPGAVEKPAKGETPAERVARLRSELEDAERELKNEGLPGGFTYRDAVSWSYDPLFPALARDIVIGFTQDDSNAVYFRHGGPVLHVKWADLAAWVDYIRENDLAPE